MQKSLFILTVCILLTTGCKADNQSETRNGIGSALIIKTIDKERSVTIQGKIITDDLDFTKIRKQVLFSSSQLIATVAVPVTFIDCIFMGNVMTNSSSDKGSVTTDFNSSLTFEACDFRGDANFDNTTVNGSVNFTGAVFREKALFNNVTFRGRQSYFTAFTSEKLFSMQESKVEGAIDFFKGKVTGKISFQSTEFCGNARFSNLDVNGKSDFSLTRFRSDALFTYANFGNEFRMANTSVSGKLDLISVVFQSNAWLTNSAFSGKVNLTRSEAKGNFDLSGSIFQMGRPVMDEFVVHPSGKLITTGTQFAVFGDYISE